jgi:hypothetical protein
MISLHLLLHFLTEADSSQKCWTWSPAVTSSHWPLYLRYQDESSLFSLDSCPFLWMVIKNSEHHPVALTEVVKCGGLGFRYGATDGGWGLWAQEESTLIGDPSWHEPSKWRRAAHNFSLCLPLIVMRHEAIDQLCFLAKVLCPVCTFFFFPSLLGIKPRALHLLDKHSTSELQLQFMCVPSLDRGWPWNSKIYRVRKVDNQQSQ